MLTADPRTIRFEALEALATESGIASVMSVFDNARDNANRTIVENPREYPESRWAEAAFGSVETLLSMPSGDETPAHWAWFARFPEFARCFDDSLIPCDPPAVTDDEVRANAEAQLAVIFPRVVAEFPGCVSWACHPYDVANDLVDWYAPSVVANETLWAETFRAAFDARMAQEVPGWGAPGDWLDVLADHVRKITR